MGWKCGKPLILSEGVGYDKTSCFMFVDWGEKEEISKQKIKLNEVIVKQLKLRNWKQRYTEKEKKRKKKTEKETMISTADVLLTVLFRLTSKSRV